MIPQSGGDLLRLRRDRQGGIGFAVEPAGEPDQIVCGQIFQIAVKSFQTGAVERVKRLYLRRGAGTVAQEQSQEKFPDLLPQDGIG